MPNLVGISGSLRRESFNAKLLRAAVEVLPSGTTLEVLTIHGVPLYDNDVEDSQGIPDAVKVLKDKVAAADGLLLVTPEYNNSIPGVFKNAIDWMSRPPADIPHVFGAKPVGVIGASPGQAGTLLSQTAWLQVLKTLGTQPYFGARLQVGGASKVFDAQGKLVDAATRSHLEKYVHGFAEFVARCVRAR